MKNKVVEVPGINDPIKKAPGFAKKDLATHKLDLMALCGYGCRYCSSNSGNYLRINREPFAEAARAQLGLRVLPAEDPSLTIEWPDVLEKLERQLATKAKTWGAGKVLVFSMLTDGFSPRLVEAGVTRRALDMVMAKTSFRVRVLTKNAVVGSAPWIDYFSDHPGRFVVGLSVGSVDDAWARKVELGTSPPSERLAAHARLQAAGVPTYGMLCPIFRSADLPELLRRIEPAACETVWAEPYNDRENWRAVADGYGSRAGDERAWFEAVFGRGETWRWSTYATDLLVDLRFWARTGGWMPKLRYLLYEGLITAEDAERIGPLDGVLLQDGKADDGRSRHRAFREVGCGIVGEAAA